MEKKAPFIRNVEGGQVSYDVLSSKGNYYYSVIMLSLSALSCNCKAGSFNQRCKHKDTAEREEKKLQPLEKPAEASELATLNNRNAGFSLLRK